MDDFESHTNPLRVAIIGAGPAGFYTAEQLVKALADTVEVDIFDRLPTPFGLVRHGVAPDHQKIKNVVKVYDRLARRPNVRFYGNVAYGQDISLADLQQHYHQICFTTGAQTDRKLGIPGEDLADSHAATEFVAWYNGHPDFVDCHFDLSQKSVAVIGVGNVAIDVARILCHTPEALGQTDIADYALTALRQSQVKEVHLIGRRGPAQAAFTNPEIKELGELTGTDIIISPEEVELDNLSQRHLAQSNDKITTRKLQILQSFALEPSTGKPRQLILHFLASPVELISDDQGQITAIKLVKNTLYKTESGDLRPRPTDEFETIPVGLVFRSVGYRGVPLQDIPFQEDRGIILNDEGRIISSKTRQPLPGLYTAGWIKRGPSGVIGTNKADASETVEHMLADIAKHQTLSPTKPTVSAAQATIAARQPNFVSYEDWLHLDEIEVNRGKQDNRPRVKFTDLAAMLAETKQ